MNHWGPEPPNSPTQSGGRRSNIQTTGGMLDKQVMQIINQVNGLNSTQENVKNLIKLEKMKVWTFENA